MNPAERFRHFRFPGPVTAAFAADRTHPVRALMGPQGGGKSVTVIFDALRNASLMPVCVDTRDTAPELALSAPFPTVKCRLVKPDENGVLP